MKKPKPPRRKIVGSRWRILAHRGVLGHGEPVELYSQHWHAPELSTPSVFDELCIDDWFHLEQMSARHYWMCVGPLHINVTIGRDGKARISLQRDGDESGARVEVYGDITKGRRR